MRMNGKQVVFSHAVVVGGGRWSGKLGMDARARARARARSSSSLIPINTPTPRLRSVRGRGVCTLFCRLPPLLSPCGGPIVSHATRHNH